MIEHFATLTKPDPHLGVVMTPRVPFHQAQRPQGRLLPKSFVICWGQDIKYKMAYTGAIRGRGPCTMPLTIVMVYGYTLALVRSHQSTSMDSFGLVRGYNARAQASAVRTHYALPCTNYAAPSNTSTRSSFDADLSTSTTSQFCQMRVTDASDVSLFGNTRHRRMPTERAHAPFSKFGSRA